MLEVDVSGQNGHSEGGLSFAEQRTHFGLWAAISSPLTLSFDVGNTSITDAVWPFITNPEVLAVSQSWYGHPGTLTAQDKDNAGQEWQIWTKPQAGDAIAVLIISRALGPVSAGPLDLSLPLGDYLRGPVVVRDLWQRADMGTHVGTLRFPAVAAHDSVFLLLRPAANETHGLGRKQA